MVLLADLGGVPWVAAVVADMPKRGPLLSGAGPAGLQAAAQIPHNTDVI